MVPDHGSFHRAAAQLTEDTRGQEALVHPDEGVGVGVDFYPGVEAEYTQLTRDYDITRKNYEQLVAKRESARMSNDMDSQASAALFRVIDPPRVGTQPATPNRPLLLFGVLILSIAIGLAFAYLKDQLRPVFFDARTLRAATGLPILGTVSVHVGHGRWAALGDALCNLLAMVGYDVDREFYLNDFGTQMEVFAASVEARYLELSGVHAEFPAEGYHGTYVVDIARTLLEEDGGSCTGRPGG